MMLPRLENDIVGCVLNAGYSYVGNQNLVRHPALAGRPRYRLKDTNPTNAIDITMVMNVDQMSAWQSFWRDTIDNGNAPFAMRLMLGDVATYTQEGGEWYTVHAIGSWTANFGKAALWDVNLKLEIPSGVAAVITYCDVIWAGEIDNLPPDDIYGGPIDDLAVDVIEPCERVSNG